MVANYSQVLVSRLICRERYQYADHPKQSKKKKREMDGRPPLSAGLLLGGACACIFVHTNYYVPGDLLLGKVRA